MSAQQPVTKMKDNWTAMIIVKQPSPWLPKTSVIRYLHYSQWQRQYVNNAQCDRSVYSLHFVHNKTKNEV